MSSEQSPYQPPTVIPATRKRRWLLPFIYLTVTSVALGTIGWILYRPVQKSQQPEVGFPTRLPISPRLENRGYPVNVPINQSQGMKSIASPDARQGTSQSDGVLPP